MAATVDIREWNGAAPGSPTDKTSGMILFQKYDRPDTTLLYPIVKSGSTVYSYEKWIRLHIGGTPPDGSITSPRAFSDGSAFGTGVGMLAGVTGSTYVDPIDTLSSFATNDFFSYTSGSALAMDQNTTPPYSGTDVDIADFLVMQASVASTADPGLTSAETLSIAFDET